MGMKLKWFWSVVIRAEIAIWSIEMKGEFQRPLGSSDTGYLNTLTITHTQKCRGKDKSNITCGISIFYFPHCNLKSEGDDI